MLQAILFAVQIVLAEPQSLTTYIHRTQAATERTNDLWCYDCDSMENGNLCVDILETNTSTSLIKKCKADEFVCMVKRFSYTLSTENSTFSSPKMWSLNRRCAVNCENGCIVIGERTKLYACSSCCEKALCNVGNNGMRYTVLRNHTYFKHFAWLMIFLNYT